MTAPTLSTLDGGPAARVMWWNRCMLRTSLLAAALCAAAAGAVPDIGAPGGGAIQVLETPGDRVRVTTNYWRLEFDLRKGGVLDTIVFPHGSGKNLLAQPFRGYVDNWSDVNASRTESHSSRGPDSVRLEISGRMASAGRAGGPVEFRAVWTISPFTVRADYSISLAEDLRVSRVGVGSTAVRSDLHDFGFRVGPARAPDKPKRIAAQYFRFGGTASVLMNEQHAPMYTVLFHRNVEGLDFTMASDLAAWESGLTGREGTGRYLAQTAAGGEAIEVLREPLSTTVPVSVRKGQYTFSYYLGLPRIVERSDRKWRHIAFNNHPWPSEEQIRRWAESGVNIARLHKDFSDDGNFWCDGAWPPYDEKGMAELRRVIAAFHRYKISVDPYFSVHEFHPSAQGYAEHEREWARTVDQAGTVLHNSWRSGEFGAQMCPQSGWLDRRKSDVEKAYHELGFDGVYYDWGVSLPCVNPKHNPNLHVGTDGIIDLLAWTRRLIAPNGVLIVHCTSLRPSISFENYADLVVNMEVEADSEEKLTLGRVPVLALMAESIPRSPCPPGVRDPALQRIRNDIAHWAVLGMFPHTGSWGPASEEVLKLFRAFKPYRLGDYRFHNAYSGAVRTAWPDVYGAVYGSNDRAVVILSNAAGVPRKNLVWTVQPDALGFDQPPPSVSVKETLSGQEFTAPWTALRDGSLVTALDAYEYRLFEVRPVPRQAPRAMGEQRRRAPLPPS